MQLKLLEKQEQSKCKISRWKEIWAYIKEMETKRTIQIINETKTWFFEKIDQLLHKETGRRHKLIKLEMKVYRYRNEIQRISRR
jgi:hypothetical protein